MKEGFYNEVMADALKEVEGITDEFAKEFKGKKPFDKEEVSDEQLLEAYDGLDDIEKQALVQRYGQDALTFFAELEEKRMRSPEWLLE